MIFSFIKKATVVCIYCAVGVLFVFAVIISLARSVNPIAQQLSGKFTNALESALSLPVKLESFEISWSESNPIIWFNQVTLGENDNKLKAKHVVATVDLKSTLFAQKIVFKKITLDGVILRVEYNSEQYDQQKTANIKRKAIQVTQVKNEKNTPKAIISWLSSIDELQLKNSTIELLHNGKETVFTGINLDIANIKERHKLKLQIVFPQKIGNKLTLILDANGDPHSSNKWGGQIYIEAENLNLTWLAEEFTEIPVAFLSGKSSFKIWSHWNQGKVQRIHVSSLNKNISLKVNDHSIKADQLNTEFWLSYINDEWLLKSNNIYYRQGDTTWDSGNVLLSYVDKNQTVKLDGFIEQLDIALIRKKLRKLNFDDQSIPQINGKLDNVLFYYYKNKLAPNYGFYTKIKQLDIIKSPNNIGISNFSGKLLIKNNVGLLQSTIKNGVFNSNGLFRKTISIKQLNGLIKFEVNKNWRLSSQSLYIETPNLKAHTEFDIYKKADEEADVNVNAKIINVKSEDIQHYLPVQIMSTDLVNWLDKSIKKGKVNETYVLMRGNMKDFPFDKSRGVFDIGFDTQNVKLDYEYNWPILKNIDANVRFYANKMTIKGHQATLNKVQFKHLMVRIDDLNKPYLKIKAQGIGTLSNYKDFIKNSPLQSKLGAFVDQFDFYGKAQLKLNALFDLDGNDLPKIKGNLSLKKARLDSTTIKLQLKNIMGDITFTENEVSAKNIKLKLLDENWVLKATTLKNTKNEAIATRVNLTGLLDPKKVVNQYLDFSNLKTSGKSIWQVKINIPITDELPKPVVSLNFKSDLKGVAINYPYPLNKISKNKSTFNLNLKLPNVDNNVYVNASLKNVIKIKQRWQAGEKWLLKRSNTIISNAKKAKKTIRFSTAIHQLKVDVKGANVDDWVLALEDKNKSETPAISLHSLFDKVNISLQKSIYNKKPIAVFKANIQEKKSAFHYKITSDFISGQITVPKNKNNKLNINLDLFNADYLATDKQNKDWTLSNTPSLQLKIKKLIVSKIAIDKVELTTISKQNTVKIEKLGFKNPYMTFSSSGRWWGKSDDETQTNLQFLIKTDNLGKALSRFNFNESFEAGKGSFSGDFTWPGSLTNASLADLNGYFSLDLKEGTMKEVDPGVGRVFGLFSLQALPKRLFLDFSDVVGSGLEYKTIKGNFKITNGNAFTHDLKMDSTIGEVYVTGRTGLADKDYDQKLKFIPSFFTNLPLVGVLAAGPQVGLTVLIVEAFLKSIGADISKASAINYRLTGTWDNSKMEVDTRVNN